MKEKIKSMFSDNAAAKTNRYIAAGVVLVIAIVVPLLWKDISKNDFGKKKGTEKLMQNDAPDVANQNLIDEVRALASTVRDMKEAQQKQQTDNKQQGTEVNEETIRKIVSEQMGSINNPNGFGENPFNKDSGQNKEPMVGADEKALVEQKPVTDVQPQQAPQERRTGLKTVKNEHSSNARADEITDQTYLPPGSILSYYTLTGVNAPTNLDKDAKHPPVTLLTIKGNAILPNGYTADLGDCFVTAPVYGQYADSRVVGRTENISCIREDGKAVEEKIIGQINGEDGKPGWHGRTVSRTGKALAGLMRTGIYQTISDTAKAAAGGLNVNIGGSSSNGTARTQINLGGSAGQAAAKNLSSSFDKLADFYEKRAEMSFPIVELDPGRTGEIILTSGLTLKFVKEVK